MAKWATYFIIGALLSMLFPFILKFFGAFLISENPIFPLLALFFGGLGVILHLINTLKTETINGSAVLLLSSILSIIYGFSLKALKVPNAEYLLLVGVLLVAFWIMIPNNKKSNR